MSTIRAVKEINLPTTTADLDALRVLQEKPNLNDEVERYFRQFVVSSPDLRKLLKEVTDGDSVTGKMHFDDFKAAEFIYEKAKADNNLIISDVKPFTVLKALKVVLRRYPELDRYKVANTLHSESVTETSE